MEEFTTAIIFTNLLIATKWTLILSAIAFICGGLIGFGEVVVLMGPSGSGKLTFIRTFNGLEPYQKGTIEIDGIKISHDLKNIEKVRQEVGMVFQ